MKDKELPSYSIAMYGRNLSSLYGLKVKEESQEEEEVPHHHDDIEYWLIQEGSGKLIVNGETYVIQAGHFIRIFPFHVHRLVPCGRIRLLKLSFPLSLLLYIDISKRFESASLNTLESGSPAVRLEKEGVARIQGLYEDIVWETTEKQDFYEHFILADVINIVNIYERRSIQASDQTEEHNLLWKVLQYMHVHFDSSASEVAELFQISVPYLNYLFRKITGSNFNENRHQVRIRNACSMMQFQELSVAFIAKYVGYRSLSTFYRVFHRLKGVTPEEYRREVCVSEQYRADTAWQLLIYMFEHHAEALSISQTAELFCVGEATLTEILKRNYSMGFSELLTAIRLIFARSLLAGTRLPICDIAITSGFQSIRTFRRNFQKDTGMTPSEFRGEEGRASKKKSEDSGALAGEGFDLS